MGGGKRDQEAPERASLTQVEHPNSGSSNVARAAAPADQALPGPPDRQAELRIPGRITPPARGDPLLQIELARLIVQHSADLCRKIGVRERLEDDLDIRIEASLMNDGISGVAGRIQDFEPRLPSQRLFGELATIHTARKPDIGEKQADFAVRIQQS
jgi:hypothetical protein